MYVKTKMGDAAEKQINRLKKIKSKIKDLDEKIIMADDTPAKRSLEMQRDRLQSELKSGTSGMMERDETRVKAALGEDSSNGMDVDEGGRRRRKSRKTRKTRKHRKHTKKSRKHRK